MSTLQDIRVKNAVEVAAEIERLERLVEHHEIAAAAARDYLEQVRGLVVRVPVAAAGGPCDSGVQPLKPDRRFLRVSA